MTNEAEKAEFEADFAAQARHARVELAEALAALTAQATVMLETSLLLEHAAMTREGHDRKASDAAVSLLNTARRETQRALERVARVAGAR